MKKRVLSLALAGMMLLSLAACGKDGTQQGNSGTGTDAGNVDYVQQLAKDMEEYKKYVTLGEYKGVEVTIDKTPYEVTDEAVDSYINNIRSSKKTTNEITTGTVKEGDTIELDYAGTIDGVAFSGGTATDVQYTVGSGKFISDLENGLIGLEVGQEYDIPCTFPSDYNSEFANKQAIFKVKVLAIIETILPEYNDEFVKSVVETGNYNTTASTAAEFTAYVRDVLEQNAEEMIESAKYEQLWTKITETSQVSGYPEEELDSITNTVMENVETEFQYNKQYYNIDTFEEYLKQVYQMEDEEAFQNFAKEYASEYLKEKMILTLIAEKEGIQVTHEEIEQYGETIAAENNYESFQEIIDELGESIKLEIGYSVLADKTIEMILDNSVEK